jgi:hypothetical protein
MAVLSLITGRSVVHMIGLTMASLFPVMRLCTFATGNGLGWDEYSQ